MKFTMAGFWMLAISALPAVAADGDLAKREWVEDMMRRIPFRDGIFDKDALVSRSQSYLDTLVSHYRQIGQQPRRRAEQAGDAFKIHEIDSRTERLIGNATTYVKTTADGMAATLDPEGAGNVGKKDAARRLMELADKADGDGNGVLDRYEAAIAEAAFAKGVDLATPGAEASLRRELERTSSYWN
jgi:hypothetical protein